MPSAELTRASRRRSDALADERRAPMPKVPRAREPQRTTTTADCVSTLFPAVRPGGAVAAVSARRALPQFDERESATTWILGEGLKRLDPARRRRILAGWLTCSRPAPTSLVVDGGCDVRIRGFAVTGPVRAALLEWLPLSPVDLEVYESGLFEDEPAKAVTLLIRPPTIWSHGEALRAMRLLGRSAGFEPERFDALERCARRRVAATHLDRLREVAAKIGRQLPVAELPCASATAAAGCAVIAGDDHWCRAIAARQLARFATSAFVLRESELGMDGRRERRQTVRKPE